MTSKVFDLVFHSMDIQPASAGDFILYNPCDGYHRVFGRMDEDGSFAGFYDWCGDRPHDIKNFEAWALLPDSVHELHETFARKLKDIKEKA